MTTRTRRATLAVAGAGLVALAVATGSAHSAHATVTSSHITSPKTMTYLVYNHDAKTSTFAVKGTTDGTTGDHVDINCYAGDNTVQVATDVAVAANGSFSTQNGDLSLANTYRVCKLKAVPAGTLPSDTTAFAGPRILVGQTHTYRNSSGPNANEVWNFYTQAQQVKGSFDYDSIAGCGIDDGYLLDATDSLTTVTFYCNAWLSSDPQVAGNRSQLQIDGLNAYTPDSAHLINADATGWKALTYSYAIDPKTGNLVIHDTEPFVKCPDQTWPPTTTSCATFLPTGLVDHRTMVQSQMGRLTVVSDVITSTDGKSHTLDLEWENAQHFYGGGGKTAATVEYRFPGQTSYSTYTVNETVSLPAKPATIFIRQHGAADGDTSTGQGAIVYNRPALGATFNAIDAGQSSFSLAQKATVPAKGSVIFRTALVQAFLAKDVASLARLAMKEVQGCTVPNVVGDSLATAKHAIVRAHCTVGKLSRKASRAAAGVVLAQTPKRGTNVDYGTKVTLVVGKG